MRVTMTGQMEANDSNSQLENENYAAPPRTPSVSSGTMDHFLNASKLDMETAEMLKKYDLDGDGHFSKHEVVQIIVDLKNAMMSNEMLYASNKLYKRLLIGAVIFFILMLFSMFGLSYAVAVMTANTKVGNDGTIYSRDGTLVLATDSVATIVSVGKDPTSDDGIYCMSGEDVANIRRSVISGRKMLLQLGAWNGTESNQHVMAVNADGFQVDPVSRSVCFWSPEQNKNVCMTQVDNECAPHDSAGRRKLSSSSSAAAAVDNQQLRHSNRKLGSYTCSSGNTVTCVDSPSNLFTCDECYSYCCGDPTNCNLYCGGAHISYQLKP